ncbi:P protein [Sodak rhabdovirus 1]|uniref:P protein n=1 Tax=Sodak rhabdovirus 1 TaxID=2793799 RepID=A0A7T1KMV5_9RHAB|nr:P protein [Sodak rhabdovirus 1]QPO14168.1 P protein [Sodak rhabdovirus 1]
MVHALERWENISKNVFPRTFKYLTSVIVKKRNLTQITMDKLKNIDLSKDDLSNYEHWAGMQTRILEKDVAKDKILVGGNDLDDSLSINSADYEEPPRIPFGKGGLLEVRKMLEESNIKTDSTQGSSSQIINYTPTVPKYVKNKKQYNEIVTKVLKDLEELKILSINEISFKTMPTTFKITRQAGFGSSLSSDSNSEKEGLLKPSSSTSKPQYKKLTKGMLSEIKHIKSTITSPIKVKSFDGHYISLKWHLYIKNLESDLIRWIEDGKTSDILKLKQDEIIVKLLDAYYPRTTILNYLYADYYKH